MPFIVLLYQCRKAGITPQEFRDGQENTIYPWLHDYTDASYRPTKWQRHYAARVNSDIGQRLGAFQPSPRQDDPDAALVVIGERTEFPWDVMVRVEFRDELHFFQYLAWVNEPEHAEKIAEYEDIYTDPSKLKSVIIGEVID